LALARLYFQQQQLNSSFYYYDLIYSDDKNDVEALIGFGKIYFEQGKSDQAAFHFKRAVSLLPRYVPTYFDLAKLYQAKGDFDSARFYFTEIINIDPTYAEAWGGIGKLYYWTEKPYSAITYYKKAIALDPENKLWQKDLKNIEKTIAWRAAATFLFVNEKEESYNIDAYIQKYGLSKRISNHFDISLNTLFDRSIRDYSFDSLDAKRWYDNSWAKINFILPNNRFSAHLGYSKSDSRLSTYGLNWTSYFKISKFKFRNSLSGGYDYYYYWNQVGKNAVSNNFSVSYKKINLNLGFLYGAVIDNYVADYYQNIYDTIANPHISYSVSLKYELFSKPKTFIGLRHSFYDFQYQSPRYYSPNERYLNGLFISSYYELGKFYFFGDFSYNLGKETFYEEAINGQFQGPIVRYDEFFNENLNNWSGNIDIGYSHKNTSFSIGAGHFYNPYYENTTAYLALKSLF